MTDTMSHGVLSPPVALEAEQAVLGCLLFDNASFMEVDDSVAAADFHEPFHAALYSAIALLIGSGRLAEVSVLSQQFAADPAFVSYGGGRYLIDLIDRAPPLSQARHFADLVRKTSIRRQIISVATQVADRAMREAETDGEVLLAELQSASLDIKSSSQSNDLETLDDVVRRVIDGMGRPDDRPTIKTGLAKLDKVLGGAERGDLIVIGARPSMGKSALAGCIAMNVAKQGLGVVEVNGEMSPEQMTRRHLTDVAYSKFGTQAPVYRLIRNGELSQEQQVLIGQAARDIHGLPLSMKKRAGLTLGRLRTMLMREKMKMARRGVRLSLVVIDHVGLVKPDTKGRSRLDEQTEVSGFLKALADELDVVVLALAQLNRDVERRDDKRPGLADLRDSGSWEQDADVVLGIYRESYYARKEPEPKNSFDMAEWLSRCNSPEIQAIALKVREGETGTVRLWASIGHNAIRDEAPADPDNAFSGFDYQSAAIPSTQVTGETL